MRIFFVSLGCDKNLVDSEVMLGIINNAGHEIVFDEENAEIAVINTCAFITDAVSEGIENILELAKLKAEGKLKALIVTGCMPARYKNEIFNDMPEIDAIIGPGDQHKLIEIINLALAVNGDEKVSFIDGAGDDSIKMRHNSGLRILATPGHYAYLKIAEGCDNKCTYCTIPSIRGRYRSAETDALVGEAKALAAGGVKELIIVAQDTSLYGTDLYNENRLHILLRKLSEIQGIEWIRMLYCYPEHITDELIKEIASNPKICKYLDMPIQHADDKILKLMGRRSSQADIRETVQKLREAVPNIVLRTTVITGFPGEGEGEYETLCGFISDIKFDKLGVFAYSREQGTPAYLLPDQVTQKIKKKRLDGIMRLQNKISAEKRKTYVGRTFTVMIDGRIPADDVYCGRSFMDAPDIDGLVFVKNTAELVSGDIVDVLITGSADYDLIGEIANEPSE